jgi:hypothetical protein
LGHDELNVFALQASVVDLLVIIIVFFGLLCFFQFTLSGVAMVVACVRVAGVGSFGSGQLLRSGGLGLRVEVFDFGFTEDAIACQDYDVSGG